MGAVSRLTRYITAEGGIGTRQAPLALQPVWLAPEIQTGILMLHRGDVIAICQQRLAEPHFTILNVCLVVKPAATPHVQQIPHAHPG